MSSKQPPNLPQATIDQLLRNQEKELAVKAQELSLQAQQDKHSYEFAKESLAVKAAGQEQKQQHESRMLIIKTVGLLVFALLVCLLIAYALFTNHDNAALEIIKALVYLSGGAVAGYGYAKSKSSTPDD